MRDRLLLHRRHICIWATRQQLHRIYWTSESKQHSFSQSRRDDVTQRPLNLLVGDCRLKHVPVQRSDPFIARLHRIYCPGHHSQHHCQKSVKYRVICDVTSSSGLRVSSCGSLVLVRYWLVEDRGRYMACISPIP